MPYFIISYLLLFQFQQRAAMGATDDVFTLVQKFRQFAADSLGNPYQLSHRESVALFGVIVYSLTGNPKPAGLMEKRDIAGIGWSDYGRNVSN